MSDMVKTLIKSVVTGSCMIATNEMVNRVADPYKIKKGSLALNIAGCAIGFVIGKEVADEVVWAISDAIKAYGKES